MLRRVLSLFLQLSSGPHGFFGTPRQCIRAFLGRDYLIRNRFGWCPDWAKVDGNWKRITSRRSSCAFKEDSEKQRQGKEGGPTPSQKGRHPPGTPRHKGV